MRLYQQEDFSFGAKAKAKSKTCSNKTKSMRLNSHKFISISQKQMRKDAERLTVIKHKSAASAHRKATDVPKNIRERC